MGLHAVPLPWVVLAKEVFPLGLTGAYMLSTTAPVGTTHS